MNNQDYEQKKRECWEEYLNTKIPQLAAWNKGHAKEAFDFAFDRAYALGIQEQKKPKRMCLRDRSKVCNLCHECDIDPDAWYSMYNR